MKYWNANRTDSLRNYHHIIIILAYELALRLLYSKKKQENIYIYCPSLLIMINQLDPCLDSDDSIYTISVYKIYSVTNNLAMAENWRR